MNAFTIPAQADESIEVKDADDRYVPPVFESTVKVHLAQFDKEQIAEYLRHHGYSVNKSTYVQIKKVYVNSGSDDDDESDASNPVFTDGALHQIEKLAICGLTHAAQEMTLEIVGRRINRKLT